MKEEKDIQDDEIRIIGEHAPQPHPVGNGRMRWRIMFGCTLLISVIGLTWVLTNGSQPDEGESYFEPQPEAVITRSQRIGRIVDLQASGFCEIRDTTVNDIPLRIYIPHNAGMTCMSDRWIDKIRLSCSQLRLRISARTTGRSLGHLYSKVRRWHGGYLKKDTAQSLTER